MGDETGQASLPSPKKLTELLDKTCQERGWPKAEILEIGNVSKTRGPQSRTKGWPIKIKLFYKSYKDADRYRVATLFYRKDPYGEWGLYPEEAIFGPPKKVEAQEYLNKICGSSYRKGCSIVDVTDFQHGYGWPVKVKYYVTNTKYDRATRSKRVEKNKAYGALFFTKRLNETAWRVSSRSTY